MALTPKCHPDKPHRAFGLCRTCYMHQYQKSEKARNYQKAHRRSPEGKAYNEAYRKANRASGNAAKTARICSNKRYKEDIQFKLTRNLRSRLLKAFKENYRAGSAIRDLGCSIAFLKQYLETLWLEGMTWENHTVHGWHIDHIRPLASFDLTDPAQVKQACHYTNLQPLWGIDNIKKGDKVR